MAKRLTPNERDREVLEKAKLIAPWETDDDAGMDTAGYSNHFPAEDRILPLEVALKDQFEHAFGADFSGVRIHSGTYAEQITRMHSASAITVGEDIYFAAGKYAPDSEDGLSLLTHELQHVIQNQQGRQMVYLEDIESLEIEASLVEEKIRDYRLHDINVPILRSPGDSTVNTDEINRYEREETAEVLKHGLADQSSPLTNFLARPDKPVYKIKLANGKVVKLAAAQYNKLVVAVSQQISEWMDESSQLLPDTAYEELVLNFLQWLEGNA